MIAHYNIYNNPINWPGATHIAVFFFADCEPEEMLAVGRYIIDTIDSSIGKVFFTDWDWKSKVGRLKIESSAGCTHEALDEACQDILKNIR